MSDINKSVIIIGAGLVGSLCACFMAKRGYNVTVYEKREDIRKVKDMKERSINLNLTHRGRKALRFLDLEDTILKAAVPMKGRLLHNTRGDLKSIPYDTVFDQCGYSVSRAFLNRMLLEAADINPNVKLYFRHKLTGTNFSHGTIDILKTQTSETFRTTADFIIGSDGAYSKLRSSMQQRPMFKFSQHYIDHGYLELSIEPQLGDKLLPNHLHVWPRKEFMMIALPNLDSSWTVTLFMPFDKVAALRSEDDVLNFFRAAFPDVTLLLGEKEIVKKLRSELMPLVSIKCDPFHVAGKFLLIGDAAHAVVPFYGQGMNAGFEDCSILNELLDENTDDIDKTIYEFSLLRVKDAHCICDLALYNYVEMRELVTKTSFLLRKKLDELLFSLFPTVWIPLYWTVNYSSTRYSECLENKEWQNKVVRGFLVFVGLLTALLLYIFI